MKISSPNLSVNGSQSAMHHLLRLERAWKCRQRALNACFRIVNAKYRIESLLSARAGRRQSQRRYCSSQETAQLIQSWTLRDIFRSGFRHLNELRDDTRRLLKDPVLAHWATAEDKDGEEYSQERRDRAFLIGIAKERPLLCGEDIVHPKRGRPFKTLNEITQAAERLGTIQQSQS